MKQRHNCEFLAESWIDQKRDARARLVPIAVAFPLVTVMFLITGIFGSLQGDHWMWLLPVFSISAFGWMLRIAYMQYRGKVWPHFDLHRYRWIFGKPIVLVYQMDEPGDRERWQQLLYDCKAEHVEIMLELKLTISVKVVLFRNKDDAMLFKLTV